MPNPICTKTFPNYFEQKTSNSYSDFGIIEQYNSNKKERQNEDIIKN